ncbi:MAG TPA: FAD-binding protein [Bacteroidetes bacterium]|nr:FAD-binding protein [Bacteroidota bacterium]
MPREFNLTLPPAGGDEKEAILRALRRRGKLFPESGAFVQIAQKSLDARRGTVRWHYRLRVFASGEERPEPFHPGYRCVNRAEPVYIVGTGPAGLFCALRLLELGRKPVLLERGREVGLRKRDVAAISREHRVDPDSNYCFGEGGAGTFSDGKLYTRSKKRGDIGKILQTLVWHGAPPEILYDSNPHIGTDRLPGVIKKIRNTILEHGGEFHYQTRLTGLLSMAGRFSGFTTEPGGRINAHCLVLATVHSARDVYELLAREGVRLEMKGFAIGVRVEHPQELIDRIQYHGFKNIPGVPAATYRLAARAGKRGVYSFCMCPGGFIVPSATSPGEVVVNGMSPWRRNSPYANAGIVTEITEEDIPAVSRHGVLAGMKFQENLEKQAWFEGGKTQQAPAQRLTDFLENKRSVSLPSCSYFPGLQPSPLHEWLPPFICERLKQGFRLFDEKMRGFITSEAVLVGVESRTSSPVRVVRDAGNHSSVSCEGLFPCGEGAGYAGGILSSAIDGQNMADKVHAWLSRG